MSRGREVHLVHSSSSTAVSSSRATRLSSVACRCLLLSPRPHTGPQPTAAARVSCTQQQCVTGNFSHLLLLLLFASAVVGRMLFKFIRKGFKCLLLTAPQVHLYICVPCPLPQLRPKIK